MAVAYSNPNPNSHHHRHHHHRHQLVSLSPPSVDPQLHRIKLLVSAGGRILPRPSDGALRYAGGQTRVLSLPRHSLTLPDLLHRVSALFSSGAAGETLTLTPMSMSLRYQLPDQDLDALVTVSSPDDLDNMLDEFDRLAASAPDPAAARLRLFLISPSDLPSSFDPDDTGQSYIDAVNGIGPTTRPIQRKDSLVSASSTQNSDAVEASTDNGTSPGLLSPTAAVAEANSQDLSKLETIDLPQRYPFFNTQPINVVAPNHISSAQNSYKGFQPLPQLPPLPPSYVQLQNVDRYVLQPVVPPALPKGGNGLRLEDCGMCQRALPHAHSDTLINEHGNLSGFVGSASEVSSVLQSYQSEDISRLQAPQSVGSGDISENLGELKIQSSGVAGQVGSHGFTQIPEPVAGTVDHAMVSRPLGGIGVTVETQASHGMFINPQQYRHLDSLQQLPQTLGQPYFLVKQDVVSKQFGSDVGLVKNGISVAEFSYEYVKPIPGMMDSLRVCPYKNSGFNGQQKPAISVPESSYDYARPVDGMMESRRISPTETSGFNGQQKPAIFVLEASYDYARPADAMMESHRISPTETSGFNGQQKPTISVPEVSYDYARPVDGMIESHRINPTEISGSNGQQKSSVSVAEFSYDFARPVDGMEGHRVSPTETSGSNAQQKLGISVPEASYDYVGPVDGVMESGRINPMETLGFNAQQKPSISVPEFAYDNARPADGMEGRRLSPTETSGSNGQHKPAVSMPEVSYDYARHVDEMMECLHVNSTETSGSNCNQKPVVSMPEYSYDFVRHVNGMMEGLRASPSKTSGSNGQQKPAVSVLEYSYDYVRHTDGMEGLHVSPSETLGFNGQQKPTASLPEYSYNYVRPVVGMEGLHVSPSETPAISEQRKPTVPVNPNAPMNFQPEKLPLDVENSHTIRQQVGGNSVFLNNAFINSGMASEGSLIRPTYQLAPASLEFTHLQILKPADACHASTVMGNHGPLLSYSEEAKIEARIPSEQLVGFGLSAYSCGPDPVCINNNNIIDKIPIEDDASRVHSKDVLNNIAVPLNRNIQLDYSNSSSTAGHVEQFQELVTSDPLFCNQDPLKGLGSMHMLPSRSNKVSNLVPIVPVENHLVNGKGLDVPVILEEAVFHQQLDLPNKNSHPDPIQPMQDLGEALAQQVVPSFPQSSVFPASSFYLQGKMEHNPLSSKESIYIEDNANSLSQVAPGDQQCQDNKSRQVDKMNLGFPITDDIGHLQIIINSDLEELRELGSGTFGTVYHGKWRGSDVAIKRINDRCFSGKPSEKERMRADFWNEACKLADLHHPNVLAFYGVVLDGPGESFATVTEYMVNGSLRHALQKNDKSLDRRKCLLIAMDVAFGMEYLHGKNIVHFDLKSDNLLVNLRDPQRPICKVGDLGLSKVKCQTLISGGVRGTLPWMAPELLNGSSSLVSEKVDVFSFGIVMWELLTGDEPYADLHYGAIIGGIVNNTLRPPVPESCDPEWRSLMEQCWSADPSGRPSFTEIVNRLRLMAASSPKGSAQTTILN